MHRKKSAAHGNEKFRGPRARARAGTQSPADAADLHRQSIVKIAPHPRSCILGMTVGINAVAVARFKAGRIGGAGREEARRQRASIYRPLSVYYAVCTYTMYPAYTQTHAGPLHPAPPSSLFTIYTHSSLDRWRAA